MKVEIYVDKSPLKVYELKGKSYVAAEDGRGYEIVISNERDSRILAVPSVDSINCLDGSVASPDGPGYLIDSQSGYRVKGFRYSDAEVGAFRFTTKEKSYAEEVGEGQNCGVIGVAFWSMKVELDFQEIWQKFKDGERREKESIPYPAPQPYPVYPKTPYWNDPYVTWCSSDMNLVASASNEPTNAEIKCYSAQIGSMGSEWGSKVESKVESVDFERGDILKTIEIYYDSRENLEKIGIDFNKKGQVSHPKAFPAQFCQKPENWG